MITGSKAFLKNGKLVTDPTGAHVSMTYRKRELLGVVRTHFANRAGEHMLNVFFLNGEPWPVEPFVWEVNVLERTYE